MTFDEWWDQYIVEDSYLASAKAAWNARQAEIDELKKQIEDLIYWQAPKR